jgi:signal peptidase I
MDMEPPPSSLSDSRTATYHRGRKPSARLSAGIAVSAALAWACLRLRPSRVAIEGPSMMPTLLPGDWALCVSPRSYRRGDVVVVERLDGFEIVKRLTAIPGDDVAGRVLRPDEWWVQGDHAASSTDSRHFGPVHSDRLKGRVIAIYWPAVRRRRMR